MPPVNSKVEKFYFESALKLIDTYGFNSSIIVVGNEPTLETTEEQQAVRENKKNKPIDVVVFYKRLAIQVHNYLESKGKRQQVSLLLGSLNRIDLASNFNSDVVKRFIFQAQSMDIIDGLDLHIHVPNMEAFERYLHNIRNQSLNGRGFTKPLIVTEFSLVWALKSHFNAALCNSDSEAQFCAEYGLSANMTELEYLNSLRNTIDGEVDNRATRKEWGDYLLSRSYLPKNFLLEANKLFKKYHISLVTFGAGSSINLSVPSMYKPMEQDDIPWILGLYNQSLVQPNENGEPVPNNFYTRGLNFVCLDERKCNVKP